MWSTTGSGGNKFTARLINGATTQIKHLQSATTSKSIKTFTFKYAKPKAPEPEVRAAVCVAARVILTGRIFTCM